jgi:transposase-like protein
MKRGISNEYVCVCTSITKDGDVLAVAVNRATPSSSEIASVFADRVDEDTVVLCDGNRSDNVLESKCTVAVPTRINRINGYHHFTICRLYNMSGVATIYLNRYDALFSAIYDKGDDMIDRIFKMITARDGSFITTFENKMTGLLVI